MLFLLFFSQSFFSFSDFCPFELYAKANGTWEKNIGVDDTIMGI